MTFKKEIEDNIRREKDLPCSCVKDLYYENAHPTKINQHIQCNFHQNSDISLHRPWKNISASYEKTKKIVKIILNSKIIADGITIWDFKLFYRVTAIKNIGIKWLGWSIK